MATPLSSPLCPPSAPPSHTGGGAGAGAGSVQGRGRGRGVGRGGGSSDLKAAQEQSPVASSDAGIARQPCREIQQCGQHLALTLQKGKLRPGRYLDTLALLDIPGLYWATLAWWVLGELETRVPLPAPTYYLPPLLCPPPAEKHSFSLGAGPICPPTPEDPFLPAPEAIPLLLTHSYPTAGLQTHLFLTRALALCTGNLRTQVQPLLNLRPRVKSQLRGPGYFQL